MPFTRRTRRRFILQELTIDLHLFTRDKFARLEEGINEVRQLVAIPRTREEWPSHRIRSILPILRNFLRVIDETLASLHSLRTRVQNTLASFDSNEEGTPGSHFGPASSLSS